MSMKREDETQTQFVLRMVREEAFTEAIDKVRALLSLGYGDPWECIRQAERELGIEVRP